MKIGDLVMYKEGVPFGLKRDKADIGLVIQTIPLPNFIQIMWANDGFVQMFCANIAKDRIEVVR